MYICCREFDAKLKNQISMYPDLTQVQDEDLYIMMIVLFWQINFNQWMDRKLSETLLERLKQCEQHDGIGRHRKDGWSRDCACAKTTPGTLAVYRYYRTKQAGEALDLLQQRILKEILPEIKDMVDRPQELIPLLHEELLTLEQQMKLMEKILMEKNLQIAIKKVKQNKGASGIDKMTVREVEEWFS